MFTQINSKLAEFQLIRFIREFLFNNGDDARAKEQLRFNTLYTRIPLQLLHTQALPNKQLKYPVLQTPGISAELQFIFTIKVTINSIKSMSANPSIFLILEKGANYSDFRT